MISHRYQAAILLGHVVNLKVNLGLVVPRDASTDVLLHLEFSLYFARILTSRRPSHSIFCRHNSN